MQPLIVQPTNYSPYVMFDPSGDLCVKGRSLMLDPVSFYQPLIEWVTQLNTPLVNFVIELDYFNTSSSKKMLELLKILNDHADIQEFRVIWGFESDDEDILEKGHIFEERLAKARFQFHELAGHFGVS